MESAIADFAGVLAAVCSRVESAASDFSSAVSRRPIPLDSAAAAFLQGLERRAAAACSSLAVLDSMALGTVSFEELLGHCTEVYKLNARLVDGLQDRLAQFGYIPEVADEEERSDVDNDEGLNISNTVNGLGKPKFDYGSLSAARTTKKTFEDETLFGESMSLREFGLSDACLATLSIDGNDCFASSKINSKPQVHCNNEGLEKVQPDSMAPAVKENDCAPNGKIKAPKDMHDQLPPYMKSLASHEELVEAVGLLNSFFERNDSLNQDDAGALGLGRKGRSFLLLLSRMNQLAKDAVDGSICFSLPKT